MKGLRIIMLGKLRSGKTTVGKMICDTFAEKGIILNPRPLATPIYEEAKSFYERHGLNWRKNRRLLEGIGEALNDDYPFGDKIIGLYRKDFKVLENIYVEDCRRLTQAKFFAEFNNTYFNFDTILHTMDLRSTPGRSIFIRVSADEEIRKSRCKPGEWAEGHISDFELDFYPEDYILHNHSDNIEELQMKVKNLSSLILKDLEVPNDRG
jgi:hypothetical protein